MKLLENTHSVFISILNSTSSTVVQWLKSVTPKVLILTRIVMEHQIQYI